jgi:hypothetical protein
MCRVFFIQMIMPYLYGRNNQHGFNSVSRILRKSLSQGVQQQFRLPQQRGLEDTRCPFERSGQELRSAGD